MSAATKPGLSGPLGNRDGKFQSSLALTREYDSWIKRFQAFSGPTCIAKARSALPSAFLTQMVVPMALAMQCTRDKDLREQGTRLLVELADAGFNLARYNPAVQRTPTPEDQPSAFELMSLVPETETDAIHAGGPAPDLTSVLVQRF